MKKKRYVAAVVVQMPWRMWGIHSGHDIYSYFVLVFYRQLGLYRLVIVDDSVPIALGSFHCFVLT